VCVCVCLCLCVCGVCCLYFGCICFCVFVVCMWVCVVCVLCVCVVCIFCVCGVCVCVYICVCGVCVLCVKAVFVCVWCVVCLFVCVFCVCEGCICVCGVFFVYLCVFSVCGGCICVCVVCVCVCQLVFHWTVHCWSLPHNFHGWHVFVLTEIPRPTWMFVCACVHIYVCVCGYKKVCQTDRQTFCSSIALFKFKLHSCTNAPQCYVIRTLVVFLLRCYLIPTTHNLPCCLTATCRAFLRPTQPPMQWILEINLPERVSKSNNSGRCTGPLCLQFAIHDYVNFGHPPPQMLYAKLDMIFASCFLPALW
jgi:hypothetical protein